MILFHDKPKIVFTLTVALFVFVISNLFSIPVSAQTENSWPMVAGNPERTSWTPEEVGQQPVEWYRIIEPFIGMHFQPIAAVTTNYPNGLIFVSTSKGLYAFRADTGATAWQFHTELPLGNSPTVSDDVVYVGGFDRKVYAINANTGGKLWEFTDAQAGYDTNPIVVDNKVIMGNHDGYLYAVNTSNGSQAWR
jgi:outer membrane protein assembly factor BamB